MPETINTNQDVSLLHPELDTHALTLGRGTVMAHDKLAIAEITGVPVDPVVSEKYSKAIEGRINLLSDLMQDAKLDDKWEFGAYTWQSMPEFLRFQYQEETGDRTMHPSYLRVADWMFGDPNNGERVINFFQAHNDQVHRRQSDPEFIEFVEAGKHRWASGVDEGIKAKWIDGSARDRVNQVEEVSIYEGDAFNTLLVEALGFHYSIKNEVVLAPEEGEDTLVHELNHAELAAGDIDNTPLGVEWINEALTEHSTHVVQGVTSVEKIVHNHGAYRAERKLLKTIATAVRVNGLEFKISDLTRAYSMADPDKRHALLSVMGDRMRRSIASIEVGGPNDSIHPFEYIGMAINHFAKEYSGREPEDQGIEDREFGAYRVMGLIEREVESKTGRLAAGVLDKVS